jgi:hypothetical protein
LTILQTTVNNLNDLINGGSDSGGSGIIDIIDDYIDEIERLAKKEGLI